MPSFSDYVEKDNYFRLIRRIKKECKPFLKQSKLFPLYRGMDMYEPYGKKTVRTDRKPLDTPKDLQKRLDTSFKNKFGWNTRSNGLFTIGNRSVAAAYGNAYLIFPIGDFKFVWSPIIKDLWQELSLIGRSNDITNAEPKEISITKKNRIIAVYDEDIEQLVDMYQDNHLDKAIKSNREIMVGCKEYYYMDFWRLYEFFDVKYDSGEYYMKLFK